MNIEMVVLRLLHVVLGVFWAGSLMFVATYLEPSVRDAGPAGAGVMQGIQKRNFLTVMPLVALVTILTGLRLYWIVSGGFSTTWMTTPYGASLTLGALLSIVALALGLTIMRPAAMRAARIGQQIAGAPEDPGVEPLRQEVAGLRLRMRVAGRWIAGLLLFAVITMAVARYL